MTPLRQRMLEDMRLRGLSASTQDCYVRAVRQLAEHYGKSPDLITEEELRRYFLYLLDVKRLSRDSITRALCAIKFFFEHTIKREWHVVDIVRPPKETRLPLVLSRDEVRRVLHCVRVDSHRVCLTTIYACGLRLREGVELKVSQVDGDRGQLRIVGKGNKHRVVPLSRPTLEMLRKFWRTHRSPRWLFPARDRRIQHNLPDDLGPVHFSSVQSALRHAAKASGVRKPVTARSLRHSYATHLLESGVNLRLIQAYLGHSSPRTTMVYTHLTREVTETAKAPIEALMDGL